MQFTVNGQARTFSSEQLKLYDFLLQENLQSMDGMAVAVNQEVIPRTDWHSKIIHENDQIIIIKATQGG